MARFFEQKLNFSLFYQNLIGKTFYKNSKRKWFRKVETIGKCQRRMNFDHLLAVNPYGLQIYFVKLTSKFGKIGLFDDPDGQGSSPKDFKYGLGLSNGLDLRPRKEKSRFGCFGTSQ
jgi:hypothetical protein